MEMSSGVKKGSITVEASITFTIFFCFFVFLSCFVQAISINISLNHAVNEATHQLAASCYPLKYLNALEDDFMEDEASSTNIFNLDLQEALNENTAQNAGEIIQKLLTGEFETQDMNDVLSSLSGELQGLLQDKIKEYIRKSYSGKYYEKKVQAKYAAAQYLMRKFCEHAPVNDKNLKFIMIELPQSEYEFNYKSGSDSYNTVYKKLGFLPGKDDVVVAVEYTMKISFPFFTKTITTRHIAVEKAWLHGGNGVITAYDGKGENDEENENDTYGNEESSHNDEEDNSDKQNEIVYITRTGTKYHKGDCPRAYLSKSRIAISISDAEGRGYTPCKVCVTKTAKPLINYGGRSDTKLKILSRDD